MPSLEALPSTKHTLLVLVPNVQPAPSKVTVPKGSDQSRSLKANLVILHSLVSSELFDPLKLSSYLKSSLPLIP